MGKYLSVSKNITFARTEFLLLYYTRWAILVKVPVQMTIQ